MIEPGKATIVIGTQFGDEGKGKIVDCMSDKFDTVCRAQGGSNAGHTVVVDGEKYTCHLLPSGIIRPDIKVVIGNGVVIHLPSLFAEIDKVSKSSNFDISRVFISIRCHIVRVFDFHQIVDRLSEKSRGSGQIGTTGKGIGPTYSSKVSRVGLRVCDLLSDFDVFSKKVQTLFNAFKMQYPEIEHDLTKELNTMKILRDRLRPMAFDTTLLVVSILKSRGTVLVEGANSHLLDIDFGTYPYVTSSNCSVGGVCTGLGIPPSLIGPVIGVVKAYCTRVGFGPFPTELLNDLGEKMCTVGYEYGTTTGRKRRCGWLDLVMIRSADLVNNIKFLALTKLDVLDDFDEIKVATTYITKDAEEINYIPADLDLLNDITVVYSTFQGWKTPTTQCRTRLDLPVEAQIYVDYIEKKLGKPIISIGVGPSRDDIITS